MTRWLTSPPSKRLGGTAGTENPLYFLYWTNEKLLDMFVYTFMDKVTGDFLPMGPSSNIIIELSQNDPAKLLQVKVYVNDNLVKTTQCLGSDVCDI